MAYVDLDKIINQSINWATINTLEWLPTLRPWFKKTLTHLPSLNRSNKWYADDVVETIGTTEIHWYFILSPDASTLSAWTNWEFRNVSHYWNWHFDNIPTKTRITHKHNIASWNYNWVLIKNVSIINEQSWSWWAPTWFLRKINLIHIGVDWTITQIWSSSHEDSWVVTIIWNTFSISEWEKIWLEFESSFNSWLSSVTYWIKIDSWFWPNGDVLLF